MSEQIKYRLDVCSLESGQATCQWPAKIDEEELPLVLDFMDLLQRKLRLTKARLKARDAGIAIDPLYANPIPAGAD